jgi:hypothetical protein
VIDPIFTDLYNQWYVAGVKTIPLNIASIMDTIVLAFWAMGDGGKCGAGFHLNTNAYLQTDTLLLINTLKTNFYLNCTLH